MHLVGTGDTRMSELHPHPQGSPLFSGGAGLTQTAIVWGCELRQRAICPVLWTGEGIKGASLTAGQWKDNPACATAPDLRGTECV